MPATTASSGAGNAGTYRRNGHQGCQEEKTEQRPSADVRLVQSLDQLEQPRQHVASLARVAEQLGQLAHDNDDRDSVEVAGQDRLRQEAREEAQPAKRRQDIEGARDQRQHR